MNIKNKFIIAVLMLAAVGVGYFFGFEKRAENQVPAEQTASLKSASHQEDSQSGQAKIPGVAHVHALTYDHEGNLLLGAQGGLFKSKDGGKTWEKVQTKGSVNSDDWMSVVSDPRNRKVLFAGGHDLGVIKSEDGGLTWMRADEGIKGTDIHGLAVNQRNPGMLFAYSVGNGMFRTTDGALSWKRMDDGPENPGVRSLTYMAVQTGMDKSMGWDNWGLLLAGTADGLFQSFSCFCGWTKTTPTFDNTTVYTLATLQADLRTMYAGTKDGAWKTIDEGKTWQLLPGLKGLKIVAIAINPADARTLMAATEDGRIYQSRDAGMIWSEVK